MEITVRASTMVKPAAETPKQSLWISNLDMISPNAHTPTVYIYKQNHHSSIVSNNNNDIFFDPRVLKDALSKILVPFYPLAGRLRHKNEDKNDRAEINCNADGVLFVEAQCNFRADDLADIKSSLEFGRNFIPVVDYSAGISSFPLFVVQVTSLKCGGVAVGVGFDHNVADGCSALEFIKAWSEIARGLNLALPPHLDRTLLRARDQPQPLHEHNHHLEYHPPPLVTKLAATNPPTTTEASVFNFTREHINILQAKSKKDDHDNVASGKNLVKYSTFEIFAAHVWRCACKARELPDDQETQLHITTDGRKRLQPPLPPGYFGNVVFWCAPTALVGDIVSKPIQYAASCIHDALVRMDDEYLRSALDYLELQQTRHHLSTLARRAQHYKSPNLGMISWVTLPIYDADFGWGQPISMGRGGIPDEGKSYMVPRAGEKGSFSLVICLESPHMRSFSKLIYDL